MGLRPLEIFYFFSAGIDVRRQILTSNIRPRTKRVDQAARKLIFETCMLYNADEMLV